MQFSLERPKKTTCCEQSLENTKQMPVNISPIDRHFDVPDEFAPFFLQDSGKDDKE